MQTEEDKIVFHLNIGELYARKIGDLKSLLQNDATKQAQVAINAWLKHYNQTRPHHALGMRPPVPETLLEKTKISGTEKWG